jgi:tRNA(adenine34) deaminase
MKRARYGDGLVGHLEQPATSNPDCVSLSVRRWVELDHDKLMQLALYEARRALDHDDVPIGAICVLGDEVISSRHNEKELRQDSTCHAEILALQDALATRVDKYLTGVTLYTTLEPCVMCAGALVAVRCERVVFGAFDPKGGAASSLYNLCCDPRLNAEVAVVAGVQQEECGALLKEFFASKR